MSNFKILSIFSDFWTPIWLPKVPLDLFYGDISLKKIQGLTLLSRNLYGMSNFKILSIFTGFWNLL
jgi:hypothetical protein